MLKILIVTDVNICESGRNVGVFTNLEDVKNFLNSRKNYSDITLIELWVDGKLLGTGELEFAEPGAKVDLDQLKLSFKQPVYVRDNKWKRP